MGPLRSCTPTPESPISPVTLYVLLILFTAAFIRSALGFGEALLAVPLLALCIPLRVAAPLAVMVSITIAFIVVMQDFKHIHLHTTGWLLVPTVGGIPVGLLLLTSSHQGLVKGALAIIIMAFAVYSLAGIAPLHLHTDRRSWMLACGFCAGVLGGAYGMNGPPLVIYGTLRRWPPPQFRATLQAYFLPASLLGLAGYWTAGLLVPAVTHTFLLALPVTIPAVFLGRAVNQRLSGVRFLRYVYLGLCFIGVLLLVQAVRS